MFRACLHCSNNLGTNVVLEEFPVGTRIAFDPARGRLWVVCRWCERWNLSPLEERWEAIESAEKKFRDTKLRVSTDNIGMANLREGLDLIRIGDPLRPEMAAWRYSNQFGLRRRRQLLLTGGAVAGAAVAAAGIAGAGVVTLLGVFGIGSGLPDRLIHGNPHKIVARITGDDGRIRIVERVHARMSILERSDSVEPFWLTLRHRRGEDVLHGEAATRVATQILPVVNRFGGSKKLVQRSVDILEEKGSASEAIRFIQQLHGRHANDASNKRAFHVGRRGRESVTELSLTPGALHTLPGRARLALEMALHEERERRAMEGELRELENAWREAEEIGSIADRL